MAGTWCETGCPPMQLNREGREAREAMQGWNYEGRKGRETTAANPKS